MKKTLSFFLAAAMLLALTSCNSKITSNIRCNSYFFDSEFVVPIKVRGQLATNSVSFNLNEFKNRNFSIEKLISEIENLQDGRQYEVKPLGNDSYAIFQRLSSGAYRYYFMREIKEQQRFLMFDMRLTFHDKGTFSLLVFPIHLAQLEFFLNQEGFYTLNLSLYRNQAIPLADQANADDFYQFYESMEKYEVIKNENGFSLELNGREDMQRIIFVFTSDGDGQIVKILAE